MGYLKTTNNFKISEGISLNMKLKSMFPKNKRVRVNYD